MIFGWVEKVPARHSSAFRHNKALI